METLDRIVENDNVTEFIPTVTSTEKPPIKTVPREARSVHQNVRQTKNELEADFSSEEDNFSCDDEEEKRELLQMLRKLKQPPPKRRHQRRLPRGDDVSTGGTRCRSTPTSVHSLRRCPAFPHL